MKKEIVIDYEKAFNRLFDFFDEESEGLRCHWNCRQGDLDCDCCTHKKRRKKEYWFVDREEY